jgi:hypothetical protein
MKKIQRIAFLWFIIAAIPAAVFAQAFGEYGRTLGGIPHGPGVTGSRTPGSGAMGSSGTGGVGNSGGRALPSRLVVAVQDAALFPRQDDESEKITQLSPGETLIPMVQSSGGYEWYMVKTQKGLIGWVKSADVKEEKVKK